MKKKIIFLKKKFTIKKKRFFFNYVIDYYLVRYEVICEKQVERNLFTFKILLFYYTVVYLIKINHQSEIQYNVDMKCIQYPDDIHHSVELIIKNQIEICKKKRTGK